MHSYDDLFKILIIGDPKVGKSNFFFRYTEDTYYENIPFCGNQLRLKTLQIHDKTVKLQIWDTSGQENYKQIITENYRAGAHAIIICYDVTNQQSFDNARNKWLVELAQHTTNSCQFILIGTKSDSKKRVVDTQTGLQLANEKNMMFFETSAKENTNVNEVFSIITHKLICSRHPELSSILEDSNSNKSATTLLKTYHIPRLTVKFALNVIVSVAAISATAALIAALALAVLAISAVLTPVAAGVTAANLTVLGTATLLGSAGLFIYANKNKKETDKPPTPPGLG